MSCKYLRFLRLASASAAIAVLAACGGDGDGAQERSEPLPLGEGHPAAYTEQWIAKNPRALVRPEHVVVVELEAQTEDGGENDLGGEGSDEIVYHVDRPMTVTLLADEGSENLSHIVLHDPVGRELGRHDRGGGEPKTVQLSPGVHTLVLHHVAKGQPGIAPQPLFVRLADAGTQVMAADGPAEKAESAQTRMVATAGVDCVGGCSFDNSDLRNARFDGSVLNSSTFRNALLDGMSLKAVTCGQCIFTSASMTQTDARGAVLDGSNLSSANMNGIVGTPHPDTGAQTSCVGCQFIGSDLTASQLFASKLESADFRVAVLNSADFSWSDCKQCDFWENPTGMPVFNITYFQGANLSKAQFLNLSFETVHFEGATLDNATLMAVACEVCEFGPDGDGRPASIAGMHVELLRFYEADWEGVDFSTIKIVNFLPSRLLTSGSLKNASLTGITPANFFWTSVLGATGPIDISGAKFSGLDLTQADFSSGKVIVQGTVPDFSGASLSDGTNAINLSGQNLSGTAQFAGKDMRRVNLSNASLFEADLTGTDLTGAILTGADLASTSLKLASLVGAQLGVAPDSGSATAANLADAYMPLANFTDADLRSVKFDNAHVYGEVKFLRARLDSASMIGTNLAGADFTQASLADTNFRQAVLVGANFSGAVLQNTSMYNTYLQGASFTNTASVAGLSLVDAYVSTAAGGFPFTESDGTPFVVKYGATAVDDLASTAKGIAVCPNGEQGPCSTPAKLLPSPAVPYPPPPPKCIPLPPDYDNCLPPSSAALSRN